MKRTVAQNKALHLYFTHLSESLNDAGFDIRKTLEPGIAIPWTGKTIKELLFRPIMKAQLGIESTTDLSTKDIDKLIDTITRHLGEKFGLSVQFPSIETIMLNNLVKQK